jgi:hypothetical protein
MGLFINKKGQGTCWRRTIAVTPVEGRVKWRQASDLRKRTDGLWTVSFGKCKWVEHNNRAEMLVTLRYTNSSCRVGRREQIPGQGGGGGKKDRGGAINEFRPAGVEGGSSETELRLPTYQAWVGEKNSSASGDEWLGRAGQKGEIWTHTEGNLFLQLHSRGIWEIMGSAVLMSVTATLGTRVNATKKDAHVSTNSTFVTEMARRLGSHVVSSRLAGTTHEKSKKLY